MEQQLLFISRRLSISHVVVADGVRWVGHILISSPRTNERKKERKNCSLFLITSVNYVVFIFHFEQRLLTRYNATAQH